MVSRSRAVLITPAIVVGSLALTGCGRSITTSAGPATPVTPAGAARSTAPVTPVLRGVPETSAVTATPTPASRPPSATPTGVGPVTASAAGPFALGRVYVPPAAPPPATPGATPAPTPQVGVWAATCKGWAYPSAVSAQLVALPAKGAQNQPIASVVVLGAGIAGPTGITVGSPVAEVVKKEPKATPVPGRQAWQVSDGATRYVYTSWDGGKTVGSIEIAPAAAPYLAPAKANPCA